MEQPLSLYIYLFTPGFIITYPLFFIQEWGSVEIHQSKISKFVTVIWQNLSGKKHHLFTLCLIKATFLFYCKTSL